MRLWNIGNGDDDDDGDTVQMSKMWTSLNDTRRGWRRMHDCAVLGAPDITTDGVDTDGDGRCIRVMMTMITIVSRPKDSIPRQYGCRDLDGDGCDDCVNLSAINHCPIQPMMAWMRLR